MDKEEKERKIQTHEDLIIYQKAFEAAMIIFELSKKEKGRELYSTYNQILSGLVKMINSPESWLIG